MAPGPERLIPTPMGTTRPIREAPPGPVRWRSADRVRPPRGARWPGDELMCQPPDAPSDAPYAARVPVSPLRYAVSGIGSGRFSSAAAITSGNRSGVQAKAGAPSAPSAAACSRS